MDQNTGVADFEMNSGTLAHIGLPSDIATGKHTYKIWASSTGGMNAKFSRAFTDKERMVQTLKVLAKPGDAILFKGSRGMRMEQVLEAFLQEEK